MTRLTTVVRSDIDNLLKQKHFVLIPSPMFNWLSQQGLNAVTLQVYLLHWQDAMIRGATDLRSHLRADDLVQMLGCSRSSVFRAYRTLNKRAMIDREEQRNATTGRTDVAITRITLDPVTFAQWQKTPNRRMTHEPDSTQRVAGNEASTEPLTTDTDKESTDTAPIVGSLAHKRERLCARLAEATQQEGAINKRLSAECAQKKIVISMHPDYPDLLGVEQAIRSLQTAIEQVDKQLKRPRISVKRLAESDARAQGTRRVADGRTLPPTKAKQLADAIDALPNISDPTTLFRQVKWQITQGAYLDMQLPHAINVCLSVIRKNNWRTPRGYDESAVLA